jgi:multiple sugar transport system substrate-binding protein
VIHTSPTWRRSAAVAASATALVALLTACGRADATTTGATSAAIDDKPATGTVTVWAPDGDATALDTVLEPFKADNPDVDVEVTLVPSDEYNTKLQTAIAAGTTPDIAFLYTEAQTQFIASGAFSPVPEGVVDSSTFFPGSWAAGEIDGSTYSVPWYAYTRVLIYRDDFAKAGGVSAPKTWDDWIPFLKGLEAGGAQSGLGADVGWDTYTGQTLATFAYQAGANLLSDDGNSWELDTPEMVAAAEHFAQPFTDGISAVDTPQFLDSQPYLVAGTTGSMISGPWVVATLDGTANEPGWTAAHIATAPLPAGPDSGVGQLAGGSWGVLADSKNADAAWKTIRFMSQEDTQVAQYAAAGSMPAVADAWQDPSIADQPLLDAFFTQLQDVKPLPAVTTWTEVSTLIGKELEAVARGSESAADAMKNVQAQAETIGTGSE